MLRFGTSELEQLVRLVGEELEREDRYIAGCFARNPAYSTPTGKWFPGILYLCKEEYYQRVAARALLASFPFRAELEEPAGPGNNQRFDLALRAGTSRECLAVGEMKLCMESTIEADAKPVRDDIRKLRELVPQGCARFLLLFAHNPRNAEGATDRWVAALLRQTQLPTDTPVLRYIFTTEARWPNATGEREFSVIGLLLGDNP